MNFKFRRKILIFAKRKLAGCPISVECAQIATIALVHSMTLATRNTNDFSFIDDLRLIYPWS